MDSANSMITFLTVETSNVDDNLTRIVGTPITINMNNVAYCTHHSDGIAFYHLVNNEWFEVWQATASPLIGEEYLQRWKNWSPSLTPVDDRAESTVRYLIASGQESSRVFFSEISAGSSGSPYRLYWTKYKVTTFDSWQDAHRTLTELRWSFSNTDKRLYTAYICQATIREV